MVEYDVRGSEPAGITLGADGNLWLRGFALNRIGRIPPTGAPIKHFQLSQRIAPRRPGRRGTCRETGRGIRHGAGLHGGAAALDLEMYRTAVTGEGGPSSSTHRRGSSRYQNR